MNIPVMMLHFVLSAVLVPQVQEVDSAKLESSSSLLSVLDAAGVTNPENIADYVHLLPQNNFTSAGRGDETTITFYTADGQNHTINHVCATRTDDTIAFQAAIDGWDVEGSLSSYDADHIKLQYQFQVPLDVFRSPPVTMIIQLAPRYNFMPTPIVEGRDGGTDPQLFGIGGVYATDCKCIGKGTDGVCVARDCADGNSCGDVKECLETEVGGSTSFLSAAICPALILGLFLIIMSRKRDVQLS